MQTFKLELTESVRVQLHMANIIIHYRRKSEAMLQRLTIIIETLDTHNRRSPTKLAELIELQNRITRYISDLNMALERARARYAENQSSLSEFERREKTAHYFNKK
jgi:predicted  nucleic acid-binding Zn-ribbon protein